MRRFVIPIALTPALRFGVWDRPPDAAMCSAQPCDRAVSSPSSCSGSKPLDARSPLMRASQS